MIQGSFDLLLTEMKLKQILYYLNLFNLFHFGTINVFLIPYKFLIRLIFELINSTLQIFIMYPCGTTEGSRVFWCNQRLHHIPPFSRLYL